MFIALLHLFFFCQHSVSIWELRLLTNNCCNSVSQMSSQACFNSWSLISRILHFIYVIQLPSFFGNRVVLLCKQQVKHYPRPAPISAQKTMTCMTGSFILSEFKVRDVRTDLWCGTTHSEVSYLLMHTVAIPVVRESTMHAVGSLLH